jgi:glycosyltransferase involved in cell wall biosynthesis
MKILHVINTVDPATGGPIEVVKQLAKCLTSDGINSVEVACTDPPDAPYLKDFPLCVHAFGPGLLKYGYSPRLRNWLRANFRNYDCIVINGIWSYASRVTSLVLRGSNVPYILYSHGMLDPWFKRTYPLKHLKKCIYWALTEHRAIRDAKAVVFTSEEERVLARQSFRNYSAAECVIVNGIGPSIADEDSQKAAFLDLYPDLRGKRLVTQIGRIHPKKGCDLAIEAFARVLGPDPGWHLVMAGPDQVGLQKHLESIAKKLQVSSRITWTGMLKGDLKWGAIRASEAVLLPSHQENFGIVVVEALSCGVPVLMSSQINIWREVEADGGGIVRSDDLEGTCDLLRSWLAMTVEERCGMRQRARDSFAARFQVARAASALSDLLRWAANVPGTKNAPEVKRYVQP